MMVDKLGENFKLTIDFTNIILTYESNYMFILSYWTVQKLKYGIVVFFESVEPIKQLTNWLAKKRLEWILG